METKENRKNKIDRDIAAVKKNGLTLQFIEEQTPEICIEAVKQNGWALNFVKEQTPEICMAAMKQNGWALIHVKKQTPEICMTAVKQSGWALNFVKKQTPEMCMEAVKQNGWALKFVKKQTPEICMEAVKQNAQAAQFNKEQKNKEIANTNSIASNIPAKVGKAFPLDSNITGKRTFNVGLDIEELNKVTPNEKGKVKLEVRSFYNKQTNKPFFTVATPNGLDEHFIVATIEIDKSALLKNVLPSSGQKHVNFMLTEDKAGKATAYIPAMTEQHAALYQNAADSFKSPETNSKEITNKYKELLQEAGLPYNDIVGRGDIGESWGFARPIPTKIGDVELTHEQRNALRDGKTLELSGLKSKTGEEYKTAYVKLDPKTKTVKLLQNNSEKEKIVVQKRDFPAKKSYGMKM
ncbi:MAG: DUF4116 domain-containing protein [Prevotellaceae bacterium]|jgi:hypothetical protein|nr:DUF4116 domain-containing protein [Prevotellaceae bacterium]